MADTEQSNVLREYLIALGFKVDPEKNKKFDANLAAWDKGATRLSKSLVGVGVAAAAAATEFAYRMEKLYYSSKLAESAAGNLAALNFGGKQIGIANMAGQVERFASAIRANPGLIGFLNSLGVKVEGRDKADVFNDLIAATKRFPFYIGQRIAAMFGINPDDLLLMQQGLDKMKEAAALRKSVAEGLGIDMDKAAKAGVDLANQWRDVLMYAGLFKDALIIEALPAMRELAGVTKAVLEDWVRIIKTPREKLVADLRLGMGIDNPGGGVKLTKEAQERADAETVKVGSKEPKRREDMSEEMQRQRGMDPNFVPYEEATPEERRTQYDTPSRWIYNALQHWGLKSAGGGVELSEESKKRLGQPQSVGSSSDESKTIWRRGVEKLYGAIKHPQAKPREPDAASIDAVTEPDRVQIARENAQKVVVQALSGRPGEPGAPGAAALPALPGAPGRPGEPGAAALPAPPGEPGAAAVLPPLPGAERAPAEKQSLMKQLEIKYALPQGLLDRQWFKESGRGVNVVGKELKIDKEGKRLTPGSTKEPDRAMGDFQFTTPTAKQYGVKDRMDFKQAADGAARYMANLLKRYGNDLRFAAAAYNLGEGNVDKVIQKAMEKFPMASQAEIDRYVLGVLPKETKDYVNTVAGGTGNAAQVTIHQENKYNVYEASSAKDTAREIGEQQRVVNADTVRQFTGRIQ